MSAHPGCPCKGKKKAAGKPKPKGCGCAHKKAHASHASAAAPFTAVDTGRGINYARVTRAWNKGYQGKTGLEVHVYPSSSRRLTTAARHAADGVYMIVITRVPADGAHRSHAAVSNGGRAFTAASHIVLSKRFRARTKAAALEAADRAIARVKRPSDDFVHRAWSENWFVDAPGGGRHGSHYVEYADKWYGRVIAERGRLP